LQLKCILACSRWGGGVNYIQGIFIASQLSPFMLILLMAFIWLILGMLIDSISIILLTVPIFAPLAVSMGYDPVAFAIFGILIIEAGLLSPPIRTFGLYRTGIRARPYGDVEKDLHRLRTIFYFNFGCRFPRVGFPDLGHSSPEILLSDLLIFRYKFL
jgi:TRAP-type mannitol/chloroaromatic compound transport system permease large subunit